MAASKATRLVLQAVASPKPQAGPSPSVGESSTLRSSLCSLGPRLLPRLPPGASLLRAVWKEQPRYSSQCSGQEFPFCKIDKSHEKGEDQRPHLHLTHIPKWPPEESGRRLSSLPKHSCGGESLSSPFQRSLAADSSLPKHSCGGESLSNPSRGVWLQTLFLT